MNENQVKLKEFLSSNPGSKESIREQVLDASIDFSRNVLADQGETFIVFGLVEDPVSGYEDPVGLNFAALKMSEDTNDSNLLDRLNGLGSALVESYGEENGLHEMFSSTERQGSVVSLSLIHGASSFWEKEKEGSQLVIVTVFLDGSSAIGVMQRVGEEIVGNLVSDHKIGLATTIAPETPLVDPKVLEWFLSRNPEDPDALKDVPVTELTTMSQELLLMLAVSTYGFATKE